MFTDDHRELPLEWIRGIASTPANRAREPRSNASAKCDRDDLPLFDVLDALTEGRPSAKVAARHSQAVYAIREGNDRHKSALTHTMALLRLGANGEPGVDFAIRDLGKVFVDVVAPERDAGENEAAWEYQRMINGAGRLLDDRDGESTPSDGDDPTGSSSLSDSDATAQQPWSGNPPSVAMLRNILASFAAEVRNLGLVGEEPLAQTVYLGLTSRLLDKQVSLGVKGHSSSGKSYTVATVTKFFPPEAYLEFTAMSEKALIYSQDQYAHRTIVMYEVTAMREGVEDDMTSYFIRSLLSEGRIVYDVTTKDRKGDFTTRKIIKEGSTNLIFTTTKTHVHAENETRILSLATNDSNEQTANVLRAIAIGHDDSDRSEWIELQRWLASDTAEHRVVVPYALTLAELISPVAVRLRRDFSSLLALIQAHALLHQLTRERDDQGCVIATVDDYAAVRASVAGVITEGVGRSVSKTVRDTVAAVIALAPRFTERGVSTTAVAEHLRIDKSNASRRLKVAVGGGYIENLQPTRGVADRWVKGEDLPDEVTLLPDPAQLHNSSGASHQDLCGVAHEKEDVVNGNADGDESEPETTASTRPACSNTENPAALRLRKTVLHRLKRVGANGLYSEAMTDSYGGRGNRGVLSDVLAELVTEKLITVVRNANGEKFWVLDHHAACLAPKFHG